ncbi:MAG: anti-sigma factor [Acidobacteriota bacterium]|nr:anti-sigma factor [Acidobacteriota bacterium]
MTYETERIISCPEFEEVLTDYLDGVLDRQTHKAVAVHALRCPLCHSLLNEVKDAMAMCREISAPKLSMTHLEAGIFSKTMPEVAMNCEQFEAHLTDYLDGFLPAALFHRWERHAALCGNCTDLPGEVVRSIAFCYTYKMDELPIPAGLNAKILQATIGTTEAQTVKASWISQMAEWIRSVSFPISLPQLAPVAMMLIFAVLVFSQTFSGSNPLTGVYQKSFELAGQTYQQSAEIVTGTDSGNQPKSNQEPIGGIFVNDSEEKRR